MAYLSAVGERAGEESGAASRHAHGAETVAHRQCWIVVLTREEESVGGRVRARIGFSIEYCPVTINAGEPGAIREGAKEPVGAGILYGELESEVGG